MAKNLKSLGIVVLAIALAYWFARGIDWASVGHHWRTANVTYLILGAILINATMVLRALRWQSFLKPIAQVSLRELLAATVIGFGCIFLMGRAGDVVRPLFLSLKTRVQASATIATILIERIYDITAVALLFAINLLFIELPENGLVELAQLRRLGMLMLVSLLIGIVGLVILRLKAEIVLGLTAKIFRWLPKRLLNFGLGILSHLAEGLSVLLNLRELLTTIAQTALIWGVIIVSYWCVIRGFQQHISLSQTVFVLGAGLVGSLIPTPGGSAGAFHVAAQKGLMVIGYEQNIAASIAIAIHFVSFGSPFIWALIYILRTDITVSQIRAMMSGQASSDLPPTTL